LSAVHGGDNVGEHAGGTISDEFFFIPGGGGLGAENAFGNGGQLFPSREGMGFRSQWSAEGTGEVFKALLDLRNGFG